MENNYKNIVDWFTANEGRKILASSNTAEFAIMTQCDNAKCEIKYNCLRVRKPNQDTVIWLNLNRVTNVLQNEELNDITIEFGQGGVVSLCAI